MAPQGVRVVMRRAFNTRERITVQWRVLKRRKTRLNDNGAMCVPIYLAKKGENAKKTLLLNELDEAATKLKYLQNGVS